MMTDTELQTEYRGGCYPMLGNRVLAETLDLAMRSVEQEPWTQEETEFAKKTEPPVRTSVEPGIKG